MARIKGATMTRKRRKRYSNWLKATLVLRADCLKPQKSGYEIWPVCLHWQKAEETQLPLPVDHLVSALAAR